MTSRCIGIMSSFAFTAGSASFSSADYPFDVTATACPLACVHFFFCKKNNTFWFVQNSASFLHVPCMHLLLLIIHLWLRVLFQKLLDCLSLLNSVFFFFFCDFNYSPLDLACYYSVRKYFHYFSSVQKQNAIKTMLVYGSIVLLETVLPAFFFLLHTYRITIDFGFYPIDSNPTIMVSALWGFFFNLSSYWFSAFQVCHASLQQEHAAMS